jgi:hypothetical protein
MISFDAKLVLRISSRAKGSMKGEENMSDEWISDTVKRIKQSEEDKRRRESYALLREQKLASHEDKLFEELGKVLKAAVAKLNEQLPGTGAEKRFDIKTSWDSIELIGPRELSFDIKHDSDAHELHLELWKGTGSQPLIDDKIALGLNEDEEVRFITDDRPISVTRLAQSLLDDLIEHSL